MRFWRSAVPNLTRALAIVVVLVASGYTASAPGQETTAPEGELPSSLRAYLQRGEERLRQNDLDGAVADFSKVIEADPKAHLAYELRGQAREKKGDPAAKDDYDAGDKIGDELSAPYLPQVADVLRKVAEVRGLTAPASVRVRFVSAAKAKREYTEEMMRFIPPEEEHALQLTYQRLGLIPLGYSVRGAMISEFANPDRPSYDNWTKAINVGYWPWLMHSLPHELTHALQDHNFDMTRNEERARNNSDLLFTFWTLYEGDAQFTEYQYDAWKRGTLRKIPPSVLVDNLVQNRSVEFSEVTGLDLEAWIKDLLRRAGAARVATPFADLKVTVAYQLWEPNYELGYRFVTRLFVLGGYPLVNWAYENIESSAQLLHPDRFLSGEQPIQIKMPDVASLMGPKWKLVRENTLGEWGYRQIPGLEAKHSLESWRGDRYATYEGPEAGDVCVVQLVLFETEENAQSFVDGYSERVRTRYRSSEIITEGVTSAPQQFRIWRTNEGGMGIERKGTSVLIVDGAPQSGRN